MGRKLLIGVLGGALVLAAAYMIGPRVSMDATATFDPSSIGDDPDAYLAKQEKAHPRIRPGLAKEIIWANPATKARTPLAIIYLHGFSASKGEIRPLPDLLATTLGANLYYTRFAGHGEDGPAMGTATLADWMNDVAEAFAIGRLIGERVIVVATSTGATLATLGFADKSLPEDIAAAVFLSPNFRVKAAGASLLTGPWGLQIAELVGGKERGFEPKNELVSQFWTTRYPMAATLPMAASVKLAEGVDYQAMTIPALFVFSDDDRVVDAETTRDVIARWGAPHETVEIEGSGDPSNHVNAGDAYSPETTGPIAKQILDWLTSIGLGG